MNESPLMGALPDPPPVEVISPSGPPAAGWPGRLRRGYAFLVQRLGRVTSSGRYIPEIDALRFVAIFAVFWFHLRGYIGVKMPLSSAVPFGQDWLSWIAEVGGYGVQLFFVISGFIIGLPFAAHCLAGTNPVSLRTYFLRRVTRLEPPYLASITILLLLLYAGKGIPWSEIVPGYLASCVYFHNMMFGQASVISGVAWSLEVEVQFYILAPLLAHLFAIPGKRARRLGMAVLIAAIMAAQRQWLDPETWCHLTILAHAQYFLVGFLFADIYLLDLADTPGSAWAWEIVSLLGWPALVVLLHQHHLSPLLLPGLFLLLFVALFRSRYCRRLARLSAITTIGGMCYSIYLLHYPVISLVGRFTKEWPVTDYFAINLFVQTLLVGVPTLVVCGLFFVLVEKPCMNKDWPRRLIAWLRMRKPDTSYPGHSTNSQQGR